MKGFIEVTEHISNDKYMINIDKIIAVEMKGDGNRITMIRLDKQKNLYTVETYEEIKQKIKEAQEQKGE